MDKNSPVIGKMTRLAHELMGEFKQGMLMPWDGKYDGVANWPNVDNTGWMDYVFEQFLPNFDHARFDTWIEDIRVTGNKELFLWPPLCVPPPVDPTKVKHSCVVGDDLHIVDQAVTKQQTNTEYGDNDLKDEVKHDCSVVDEAAALVPILDAKGKKLTKRKPRGARGKGKKNGKKAAVELITENPTAKKESRKEKRLKRAQKTILYADSTPAHALES